MTSTTPTPRVVLLAAIESATSSEQVVATASRLAHTIAGAELHLLHVIDVPMNVDGELPNAAKTLEDARTLLARTHEQVSATFSGRVFGHLSAGTAWREIVQLAIDLDADLVIVGTADKKGVQRLLLGSVAEQVTRKAPCAVLVARAKEAPEDVPEIVPPCPDCLETQRKSERGDLWCSRHTTKHVHARLHYETPPTFGVGSMLLRT